MRRRPCMLQIFTSVECALNFVRFMEQKGHKHFKIVIRCRRCKRVHVKDLMPWCA